jgi:hypothetical protein
MLANYILIVKKLDATSVAAFKKKTINKSLPLKVKSSRVFGGFKL